MTILLSISASIFNLLSGGSYLIQVIKGKSIPNPATWLIWVVVTIINTLTYFSVVHGNIWVSLSSIVLALGILFIFLFSLIKGKFSKLGRIEIVSLVIAFGIGLFWKLSGNSIISNIALQAVFLISFYPTLIALLKKETREKPLAWFFASSSYSLQIINVFVSGSSLFALAFPIVNLVGNGTIGIIALFQNKRENE
ncbi:MAG: hypothetical protein ACYCZW_01250 [Minisyncoccota bacterium]